MPKIANVFIATIFLVTLCNSYVACMNNGTTSALDNFENEALKSNQKLVKTHIDDIENKINENEKLAGLKITRKEIIIFLHSAYYNVEKAYTMIETNYHYRSILPVFFEKLDLNSEVTESVLETLSMSILPVPNERHDECHIYVALLKSSIDDFDYKNTLRYFFMLIEYLLKTKGTFKGVTVYLNAKDVTVGHIGLIPFEILTKLLTFLQTGLPVRLISIIVINFKFVLKISLQWLIRLFLKDTIRNKIHFYSKKELSKKSEMINIWPHMPSEINGSGESQAVQSKKTYQKLLEVNEWYAQKKNEQKILREYLLVGRSTQDDGLDNKCSDE